MSAMLLSLGGRLRAAILCYCLRSLLCYTSLSNSFRIEAISVTTMPTALRNGPYRFYFYSYDCREPRHMHVDREQLSAKLWLDPDVRIADNQGYDRQELRAIERIARQHVALLRSEWDNFCGSNTDDK